MRRETGPSGPVVFSVAAFLLVFAPLVRGGNRPLALLVLELAAILGLALLLSRRELRAPRGAAEKLAALALAILLAVPLLQLLPLPYAWWPSLPGHEPYAQALEIAGAADGSMRALTLNARATQYAWLALVPCVAMFLLTRSLERGRVRRLVVVFAAVAVCEAVLGILQAGAGPGSVLQLGNPFGGGSATGTYVNKNHFAALMAMALPIALVIWMLEILPTGDSRAAHGIAHPRDADARLALRIALSIALVVLLVALLFTRSRAGIGTGLAAFGAATFIMFRRYGSIHTRIVLGLVALAAFMLAAYVGLTPILDKFAPEEFSLSYEGRARLSRATYAAGVDFMPFGSGLGTFADVFRRYQPEHLTGFFDHAHNDYAEALLELGVAGIVAIALMTAAYALRWRHIATQRLSRRLGHFQIAAGFGMLAMALHSAFDFNFHIPANAIYFSFLAGVFFHDKVETTANGEEAAARRGEGVQENRSPVT